MNGVPRVTSMSGLLKQPSRPNKSLQPTGTTGLFLVAASVLPVAEH
jgi:hypothetical protein